MPSVEMTGPATPSGPVQVAFGTHLGLVVPHPVDSLEGRDGHCRNRSSRLEGQGDAESKQRKSAKHGISQGKLVCCNGVRCRVEVDEYSAWREHAAFTARDQYATKQR